MPLWFVAALGSEPLPGTKPLTDTGDLAAKMVAGLHAYLDRELAAAPAKRDEVKPDRERLRKLLGVVDKRVSPRLEVISRPGHGQAVQKVGSDKGVYRVRWAVLPGVDAEGLYLPADGDRVIANVVAIPDAGQTPEQIAGVEIGGDFDTFTRRLARAGCNVLVPTIIDRADTLSGNPVLGRKTNQPHREFIHRMAFETGRTTVGYEVQKVLAAADWFTRDKTPGLPLAVIGYGEGGRVALYSAALDERFDVCQVAGAFGPQERCHEWPLDRNLFGMLTAFGDAEVGSLVAPRKLVIDPLPGPAFDGPKGRGGAAPGTLGPFTEAEVRRAFDRLESRSLMAVLAPSTGKQLDTTVYLELLRAMNPAPPVAEKPGTAAVIDDRGGFVQSNPADPAAVAHQRQFDQLVAHTQRLWRDSDRVRREFWKGTDASSPAAWEKSCDRLRAYFHEEVIGKLPAPTLPPNPRTRRVYDVPNWAGYEVMLDLFPDVFAYGILLLPKDLKPGEKRPTVVCQHGLEGTPRSCIDPEKQPIYAEFARKLVEKGYVVYCPQNPYYGNNTFRQVQRKANPLKLSLFSFIIAQHAVTLDWLQTVPGVDPERIGFYGLSYGGKTAMRVPAVEKRYKVSICSGDFNEWVGKNVSVDLDRSYMWSGEYEMYEFDLGNTFNYAEMAYLIAPRPFMVERGHDDGVGTDDMVASEYAKVRYLYANRLKLPERTAIEFFPGGHRINGVGTFAFLERHLGKPR
ncbi:MAG: dienelactone hydrolase family protein [Gemmataceae bacterium]